MERLLLGLFPIRIRVSLGLGVVLFAVGVGLVILYWWLNKTKRRQILVFGVSVMAGLAAIYTGLYIAETLAHQKQASAEHTQLLKQQNQLLEKYRHALEQQNRATKIANTFELYFRLEQKEIAEIRAFVTKYLLNTPQESVGWAAIYSQIKQDPPLYEGIKRLLNHFEAISVSIQEGSADEPAAYKLFGFAIPFYHRHLWPFIMGMRDENKYEMEAEAIFCEFQELAKAWESGRFLTTGDPLPELTETKPPKDSRSSGAN